MSQSESYWNNRAGYLYRYKGEDFYTITPIPYYYMRRNLIIANIQKYINRAPNKYICDFGCGDGVYIHKLYRNDMCFHGIDISEDMIRIAKKNNPYVNVTFEVSGNGINDSRNFGLIYSSAIFAHIDDTNVKSLFSNIYSKIGGGGKFIICEQTAPFRYSGKTYIRRTKREYKEMLESVGFKIEGSFIIDFWLHRLLFERKIQKIFIKHNKEGLGKNEMLISLNKNHLYRMLSFILSFFSILRVFKKGDRWGYSFIVARRKTD